MTVTKTRLRTWLTRSLSLVLLFPVLSFAADYYIDGATGSDANVGSADSPWKTIGHALRLRSLNTPPRATDTVYIKYGTYKESLNLKPLPNRLLTLKGVSLNGKMPLIDANGITHALDLINFNGLIQGLEITGAAENGINISGDSKNAQIIGCIIHGNNKGIHVNNTSTPFISGNLIYDNTECGIGNMGTSAATIEGNQIYHNGNKSPAGPSAGICIPENSTPEIYNNIIRSNYNSGITMLDNAAPVIINNTIINHRGSTDSPGTGIRVVQNEGIGSVTITNNIINDNDTGLYSQKGISVAGNTYNDFWQNDEKYFGFSPGEHEIFTDPLLTANYSLKSGSSCINAGTATGAPATDLNGIARPQGEGFDIGACEYLKTNEEEDGEDNENDPVTPFLFLLLQ
jgi:parallel beta-helix repeat protein